MGEARISKLSNIESFGLIIKIIIIYIIINFYYLINNLILLWNNNYNFISFSHFEQWTINEPGFLKEELDATLSDYMHYPESFLVSANFCV